jgi:hypothetical protein
MLLKHLQKAPEKHMKTIANIRNIQKNTYNICVKLMQHPDKQTFNIHLKTQMKHWEQKLATYVYKHCNIPNLLLHHSYKTLATYL